MEILRRLLGRLGAAGATRNALLALLDQDEEERSVDAVLERLAAA